MGAADHHESTDPATLRRCLTTATGLIHGLLLQKAGRTVPGITNDALEFLDQRGGYTVAIREALAARFKAPWPADWQEKPRTAEQAAANPANHIMCWQCWAKAWTAAKHSTATCRRSRQGRTPPKPSMTHGFKIAGPCCYCGNTTDDGIPYATGTDKREVCGGEHGGWTEGRR